MNNTQLVLHYNGQSLQARFDKTESSHFHHQIYSLFHHSNAINNDMQSVRLVLAALANRYEYMALIGQVTIQYGSTEKPKYVNTSLLNAQAFQLIRYHFKLKRQNPFGKILQNVFNIEPFEKSLLKLLFTHQEQDCTMLAKQVQQYRWYLPKPIRSLIGLRSVENALRDLANTRRNIHAKIIPSKFSDQFPVTNAKHKAAEAGGNNHDGFGGGGMLNPNNEVEPEVKQQEKKSVSKEMTKMTRGRM